MATIHDLADIGEALFSGLQAIRTGRTEIGQQRLALARQKMADMDVASQTRQRIQQTTQEKTLFPGVQTLQEQEIKKGKLAAEQTKSDWDRLKAARERISKIRGEDVPLDVVGEIIDAWRKGAVGMERLTEPSIAKEVKGLELGAELDVAEKERQKRMLPIQERIEKKMLEMQPRGASLDMQMKSQQIQTMLSERDPKSNLINKQIEYYDSLIAKAKTTEEEINFSNLKAGFQLLWEIQANTYAKKTYKKSINQLKVDQMVEEAPLTDQQVISFYLSAIDKQARMTDPFMLYMMKQIDMDPKGMNVALTDLAAFAKKLKPGFEAAVKRLKAQPIVPPIVGPPLPEFYVEPPEGKIIPEPTVEPKKTKGKKKKPSPEEEKRLIEGSLNIMPREETP